MLDDARFTTRLVRKRPGLTFLIISALAVGIGITTAVFTVINSVLLRPLPLFKPDRIMRVYARVNQTGATMGISYPEYLDWKAQTSSFEDIAVMRALSFYSRVNQVPIHLKAFAISASGFRVFGIGTALGRGFTETDDSAGAERVVVLSHFFWARSFGSDPRVIGQTISLDDKQYTIVGVLQPSQISLFQYPDVWVPNGPLLDERAMNRDIRLYFPSARLKPSVTADQARTELETVSARLASQYPGSNKGFGVRFVSFDDLLTGADRKPLSLLFGACGVIFLLACVNVVILLLSWTADRRHEIGVRMALGASRMNVFSQLLVQSVLFVAVGIGIGLALAKLLILFFLHRFPSALVRMQETRFDFGVVCFVILVALVTALIATLGPAWYISRLDINRQLKAESRSPAAPKFRTLRQSVLITIEVSLASALLLVSALLLKSFREVANADLGFDPHHTYSFQLNLPARYSNPEQISFYRLALEKIRASAGLSHSSAISSLPLTTQGNVIGLEVEGQRPPSDGQSLVENEAVLPDFFSTLKLRIIHGRDFSNDDRADSPPVAIIDDVLAEQLWPGHDPLGKRIRLVETASATAPWREVIGVVRQIKHFGPEARVRWMQVYTPEYQDPSPVMSFVINTTLPEANVKAEAQKAIQALDTDLPLDNFQSMDTLLNSYLDGRKVSVLTLGALSIIVIILAIIGIYGVVANSVVRRRREIAIRLALGASPSNVLVLLMRVGLGGALAGVLIGFALVGAFTRFLESFLFNVKPLDSAAYLFSSTVILVLAVISVLLPARRVFSIKAQELQRE